MRAAGFGFGRASRLTCKQVSLRRNVASAIVRTAALNRSATLPNYCSVWAARLIAAAARCSAVHTARIVAGSPGFVGGWVRRHGLTRLHQGVSGFRYPNRWGGRQPDAGGSKTNALDAASQRGRLAQMVLFNTHMPSIELPHARIL